MNLLINKSFRNQGHANYRNIPIEASFTPDSQFVLCGSSDGKIHIWNVEKGNKVAVLNSEHSETIQSVQFNPKYMMFASTCQQMVRFFFIIRII